MSSSVASTYICLNASGAEDSTVAAKRDPIWTPAAPMSSTRLMSAPVDDAAGADDRDVDRIDDLGQQVLIGAVRTEVTAGLDALDDDGRGTEPL